MLDYLNFLIQVILIIAFVIISFLLIRLFRASSKEKRVNYFAISALSEKPISFFDRFEKIFHRIIKLISNLLKKSAFFTNYSKKYEKFLDPNSKEKYNPMDYISYKIIISIIVIIITIISDALRLRLINPVQIILAFLVGFFIPDLFIYLMNKKNQRVLENDLLKAVIIMNNAFKSGRSIMQSVELVSTELSGPIASEFKKIYIDLTYGLDLDVVFERFSKRVKTEEVKYMSSSLVILNKTGGNVVKVFSSIEKGFIDRKKLNDELKSATALSNFVFKILIAIPILIFLLVYFFDKTYFLPLFKTPIGRIILALILLIYIIYIVIVKRITKLKE